jgi:membrane protease YdiL (CAAX protease family)
MTAPEGRAPAQEHHWGFTGFFAGIAGYHLVTLVFTLLLSDGFSEFDASNPPVLGSLLLLAFLPNVFLGLGPAALSWCKGNGPRRDFGMVPTKHDVKVGLACGGVSLLAAWALGLVLLNVHRDGPQIPSPLESVGTVAEGRSVWLASAALFLFLGAPVTEELLVRGSLWGALEHYRVPRYAVLGLTALIFAFLHQESWRTISLFAQGLALGWARMVTGRTGASMVAHATNNLLPALYLYFAAA